MCIRDRYREGQWIAIELEEEGDQIGHRLFLKFWERPLHVVITFRKILGIKETNVNLIPDTVSYTHLFILSTMQSGGNKGGWDKSPSLSIVFGLSSKTQWLSGLYYADFISVVEPVSYTHLDVYKRQLLVFVTSAGSEVEAVVSSATTVRALLKTPN